MRRIAASVALRRREKPSTQRSHENLKNLEPGLLILDVGPDKFFIRLGQVDDPFNQTNDRANAAGYQRDDYLNDSFGGVTEDEFMNAKTAEQYAADAGNNFLVSAHRFPVGHCA